MKTVVRLLMMCVVLMSGIVASAQQLTTRFMSVDDGELVEAEVKFTLNVSERTITVENTSTSRVRTLHISNISEPIARDDMEVTKFDCTDGANKVEFTQVRSTKPNKPMMFVLTYKLGDVKVFSETYMTDW